MQLHSPIQQTMIQQVKQVPILLPLRQGFQIDEEGVAFAFRLAGRHKADDADLALGDHFAVFTSIPIRGKEGRE